MGTREKDQSTTHQPLLSSLVVRPTDSGGGAAGGGGGGSDYEPGEVRRDRPPYARSDRFPDNGGYRIRAGSVSPVNRRNADHHRYSPEFDRSGGPPRNRGFSNGRDHGRHRDFSPPYGRGRGGGRFVGGGFNGSGFNPGPPRGEGSMPRNNPNVRPREGDWICPDPACNNLNFARRDSCNNCNRFRYAPVRSPRRGYPGPPPVRAPLRRFPGPPVDRSPGRTMNNSYRSPPPPPHRGWARDDPRELGPAGGPPHPRPEGGRLQDHPPRRDRPEYLEDDFRERNSKFVRPISPDWTRRDRERVGDDFFNERKGGGYERRLPSPPLPPPPHRGRWARDLRERSRSPIRGGGPPPKDYHREVYMERGREDRRHGMGRDRIGDAY